MSFWQRAPEVPVEEEVSRAEVILVRKVRREPSGEDGGLMQVAIPRAQQRRSHQRNEDRCVTPDLTATIQGGRRTIDCDALNLSSNGLMVAFPGKVPPLRIGAALPVAIGGCAPIPMGVRWVREDRVGFEFLAETSIIAEAGVQELVIATIRRDQGENSGRAAPVVDAERRALAKRHTLLWLGKLTAGEDTVVARIRNISRTGALVSIADPLLLAPGGEVVLSLEKTGDFRGVARWRSDSEIGIALTEEFPVEMLAREPCVEVAAEPAPAPATPTSREEALQIRYTGLADPTSVAAPEECKPLTLRELYFTLYDGFDPARRT